MTIPTEIISPNTTIAVSSTLVETTYYHNDENNPFILVGYSNFKSFPSYFSFYAYLMSLRNNIYSKTYILQADITYYTNMRILKEIDITCNINTIINPIYYKYYCEGYIDTANIKSIRLIGISQGNMDLVGITPIAKICMNDITLCKEKYDYLDTSNVYLMDNSTVNRYDELLFNITGEINGTQPKLENKNISLMVNLKSEEKPDAEVDCIINNVSRQDYILNCNMNETLEIDLEGSFSLLDNNSILILNFPNGTNFSYEAENKNSYHYIFSKKQKGLNSGAIAGIVICFIVVLASVIVLNYYLRKINKTKLKDQSNSSTIQNLKI